MKDRRFDLSRLVPPGYDWHRPLYRMLAGWGLGILDGLYFLIRWSDARSELYLDGVLRPDAVMPDFITLFRPVGNLFLTLAAVFLLADLAAFVVYERRGARSDYTMRRLPQRFERIRRVAALPVLGCLSLLALGFVLLLFWFLIYMTCTPARCIPPEQWAKIWRF